LNSSYPSPKQYFTTIADFRWKIEGFK